MRRPVALLAVLIAVALAGLADARWQPRPAPAGGPAIATTDNETPVLYDDEEGGNASGDDPAIWVHPDSWKSIVIVTAKEGGLRVYDLDGGELQSILASPAPRADGVDGRYNNVDIAYGLTVGGKKIDVAVVSDRYNDQLRFWAIDPAGADAATPLTEITAPEQPFLFSPDRETVDEEHTAYGVAVWQRRRGPASVVVTQEGGTALATVKLATRGDSVGYTDIEHLDMPSTFALPDGTSWTPCEEPGVGPQFEGSAVDQRSATLYSTQEDVGLWRIPLPFGSGTPVLIDTVSEFGQQAVFDEQSEECVPVEGSEGIGGPNLVADAEGVDIYYGPGATGYVLVSSQGDDRFAVYTTEGRNRSRGTFKILGVGVDDINGSDGLAVTNRRVGRYVEGLLVSHDEPETGDDVDLERDPTNFSYVDWADIAGALHLTVSTKPGNDPRFAEPGHHPKPRRRHR
jgi:3-phytase